MVDDPGAESGFRRNFGDPLFRIFLVVVFVAMAVELVLLASQNRELTEQLSNLFASPEWPMAVASLQEM